MKASIRKLDGQWVVTRPVFGFGRPEVTTHGSWSDARASLLGPAVASAGAQVEHGSYEFGLYFCCEAHQVAWHAARADRPKPDPVDPPYMPPSAALAYMRGYDYERPPRDEAAIERVQTGQWLARFAAPWHPEPCVVRAERGRPPHMLNAIRMPEIRWTPEAEVEPTSTFTQDVYRLESIDEHERSAIYRIQGLPGPRHAVFRWAAGQPPTWWTQSAWEGRWIDIENGPQGHARGHRWNYPSGQTILASPTERYETREDGAVAEVWEVRP